MRTLTLKIPDSVELNDKEALMVIASKLYDQGKLSLGQAADLVGLSKRAFMEILGLYGVSVFNFPPSDLEHDANTAKDYHI
jgi:predicted HTH domain antitoxin